MSAIFMGMAEMALHIIMKWHLPHMNKTMINFGATVHPLTNVEVVGGGRIVDTPIQMAPIMDMQKKLQSQ